jgi:cytosine/adenosine deaminase-related metal-dependent hydrolase
MLTPYFASLWSEIEANGGLFNAHLHIDRVFSYHETLALLAERKNEDASSLSLTAKHSIIPVIHASAIYNPDHLGARVETALDLMSEMGTSRADSVVDVTNDRVGTEAFEQLKDIRSRLRDRIDFRVGAYSPFGFSDNEPARWDLVRNAAQTADFIGSLPERDDLSRSPTHIGFEESCRRVLGLAAELNKQLHIHVDQQNHEAEGGSECVVRLMRELGLDKVRSAEPLVWLIHAISPSTYNEMRFKKLLDEMAACNVGVICCPSAALSMRQYRPVLSPTHNSIARVLEMLAAGVSVRLGSDNVCDITSPASTLDLLDEVYVLSNTIRYYDIKILAKLATGKLLDEADRRKIASHLEADARDVERSINRLNQGMM